jgi:hypothetical protein
MSISIIANSIAVLKDTTERISITVQDTLSDPPVNIDPYDLKLMVTNISGSVLVYDTWPLPNNRIGRSSVGEFYIDFGPSSAELDNDHVSGISTLTISDAVPGGTSAWPSTGTISIDFGNGDYQEDVKYTSVSIVGGAGTITLATPTTKAHAEGAFVKGPSRETNTCIEYLFDWRVQANPASQIVHTIQKITVVSHKVVSMVPDLRSLIDKTRKMVAPESECYIGYTDANLITYLQAGLSSINAYQPSLVFSFEDFPMAFKQILIESALIVGVMSQQLYAVDTDIPNYSDQGTSFVITHQAQLASFLNQVTQRLDKLIPQMKLQLIQPGTIYSQMGPNFRMQSLVEAAPGGSMFRGVYFKP